MTGLSCFKAYDIRGEIDVNIDEAVAYRVGRAVAQHLGAKSIVIGFDARPAIARADRAAARGAHAGVAVAPDIAHRRARAELYWAVTEFGACAGIEVTASHNPINYNGMKIVKAGSRPLDDAEDFQAIKALTGSQSWTKAAGAGDARDRGRGARQVR